MIVGYLTTQSSAAHFVPMEWATSDVLHYAPRDAVVPAGMNVPRWSWDGLNLEVKESEL